MGDFWGVMKQFCAFIVMVITWLKCTVKTHWTVCQKKWLFSIKMWIYMLIKRYWGWNSTNHIFLCQVDPCQLEVLKGDKKAWRRNLLLLILISVSVSITPSFSTLPGKLVPVCNFVFFPTLLEQSCCTPSMHSASIPASDDLPSQWSENSSLSS